MYEYFCFKSTNKKLLHWKLLYFKLKSRFYKLTTYLRFYLWNESSGKHNACEDNCEREQEELDMMFRSKNVLRENEKSNAKRSAGKFVTYVCKKRT